MHKTVSKSDGIFQAIRPCLNVRVMVYNSIVAFTFFFIMTDLMKTIEIGWWHWMWYFLLEIELSRNPGWIVPLDNLEENQRPL
jgi:hypothetical protein